MSVKEKQRVHGQLTCVVFSKDTSEEHSFRDGARGSARKGLATLSCVQK